MRKVFAPVLFAPLFAAACAIPPELHRSGLGTSIGYRRMRGSAYSGLNDTFLLRFDGPTDLDGENDRAVISRDLVELQMTYLAR